MDAGATPSACKRPLPWGFIIAILLLLAIELFVRMSDPRRMIPYRPGLQEHHTIAHALAALPPPDVMFLGSSMTEYGVDRHQIEALLRENLNRPLTVHNDAAGGAMADEIHSIVRYMLRVKTIPPLLLIETNPRQFDPNVSGRFAKNAIFWSFADWREAKQRFGKPAADQFPAVLQNQLGRLYYTFRYRARFQSFVQDLFASDPAPQVWVNFRDTPREEVIGSVARAARRKHSRAQRRLIDVNYDKFVMDKSMVEDFEKTIELCRQHNINTIFFETPLSSMIREVMPSQVYTDFYAMLDRLEQRHRLKIVTLDELGITLGDEDFVDPSHLDTQGAQRFSRALAEKVVLPALRAARR